jgi:hypothetical protein
MRFPAIEAITNNLIAARFWMFLAILFAGLAVSAPFFTVLAKIDILDTRKIKDGAGKSYEAVTVRAEGNLIRTGTVNKLEFREPVQFVVEFLFIRNPDLLGNGRLPLVVQDFKYKESPL